MEIYNTFGLPATADRYLVVRDEGRLRTLLSTNQINHPYLILGGGSNMVFTKHFPGTIIHLENKGICLLEESSSQDDVLVEAAAGEVWDDFVHYCIAHGWYGAENLVAIPGTVGAAPVQNVGAYGVEAKNVIYSVRAFDIFTGQERIFTNEECQFAYRNSIFKGALSNHYIIWSVVFRLHKVFAPDLQYKALSDALQSACIKNLTPQQLADIITEVRWRKLPRPEQMGSAGSFFKNPVVPVELFNDLAAVYSEIPHYVINGTQVKIPAAWLIDQCGWKGKCHGGAAVYEKQPLIIVNKNQATPADIMELASLIQQSVYNKFKIKIYPEVNYI
jgi:UDP-N-acetylmuramate dehydrogenase